MKNQILKEILYTNTDLPNFYYSKMVAKVDEEIITFDLLAVADTMDEAVEEFRSIIKHDVLNNKGVYVSNQNILIKDIMSRDIKDVIRHYYQNKQINKNKQKNELIDCIITTKDQRLFNINKKLFTKEEKKLIENNLIKKDGDKTNPGPEI